MSQTVDVGFYLPSTNLLDLLVSFLWCFPIVQFRSDCAWITRTMKKPKYNKRSSSPQRAQRTRR